MSLATRLRDFRIAKGLRQEDVAKALGVARNTVARWERKELGFHRAQRKLIEMWIERG